MSTGQHIDASGAKPAANQSWKLLRFAPAVETSFRALHLMRRRRAIQFWMPFSALLILISGIGRPVLLGSERAAAEVIAALFVLLPLRLILTWGIWSSHYATVYPRMAPRLVALGVHAR